MKIDGINFDSISSLFLSLEVDFKVLRKYNRYSLSLNINKIKNGLITIWNLTTCVNNGELKGESLKNEVTQPCNNQKFCPATAKSKSAHVFHA